MTNDSKLLVYDLRSILDSKNGERKDLSHAAFEASNYHSEPINTVDWSLTGRMLATAGKDKLIKVNVFDAEYDDMVC